MKEGNTSPMRRYGNIGINPSSNKLHERVAWFYRRLCEEYDCPALPQFLQETIPAAFKFQGVNNRKSSVNDE